MTSMPTLQEIQETFSLLDNWEDRYAYLIDIGRVLPAFPPDMKTDDRLIKGCTSRVWMILTMDGEKIHIQADSDALIVRGLIALVIAVYNGKRAEDIAAIDMQRIFSDLGLSEHLSPNRRNGFFAMVERVRELES